MNIAPTSDEENPFDAFLTLHNDNGHDDDLFAIINPPIIDGIQIINHVLIVNYT
ncbi:hypothetical protein ALC62_02850 [Cyphomyrmex costatus]|uniref:Uncharacterized protein n=1 Tax=Cyphomyrmex costatus TaxID=456900 RepID=A0A151IMQ2_9HYME|nr:hypothetical protein ALC62_02850 [Cyphomyrmex costatus]